MLPHTRERRELEDRKELNYYRVEHLRAELTGTLDKAARLDVLACELAKQQYAVVRAALREIISQVEFYDSGSSEFRYDLDGYSYALNAVADYQYEVGLWAAKVKETGQPSDAPRPPTVQYINDAEFLDMLGLAYDWDSTHTGPSELLDVLDDISVPDCFPDLQRQLAAYRDEVNRWSINVRASVQPSPPPRPSPSLYAAYAAYDAAVFSQPAPPPESSLDPHVPAPTAPVSECLVCPGNVPAGTTIPFSADEGQNARADTQAIAHHRPTPIEVLRGLPPGELLTAEQLNGLTGIPLNTIQKAIASGRIPRSQHTDASIHLAKAVDVIPYLAAYRPKPRRAQPPV